MRIAVLSGKGGAGKTFVAVNLAAAAGTATYIDCDVEEPNGRLFLKHEPDSAEPVHTLLPEFDEKLCTGCRKCVDFCRFNALFFARKKPVVLTEVCHSCGGCALVCPAGAVTEKAREVGFVEAGHRGELRVITGVMNTGEVSGTAIIRAALAKAGANEGLQILDCPPGSACPVVESASEADFCLLVAEPTAFGFHNFCMVHELVRVLGKPCAVVINKLESPYEPLEDYCAEQGLEVFARIPYDRRLGELTAAGLVAAEHDAGCAQLFCELLERTAGGIA